MGIVTASPASGGQTSASPGPPPPYPVQYSVDFPDHDLNRWTTAFRVFTVIPFAILAGSIGGGAVNVGSHSGRASDIVISGTGLLVMPPLLMIVFRRKYPRWWFDWNLEFSRLSNRIGAYVALMTDRYPSTDDHQTVHLDYHYPDGEVELNRWMPLVKWFLAIPHYVVLILLSVGLVISVIAAWFAILVTGRYPRGLFAYAEGVLRWHNRVGAYAFTMVTDVYPPFRLAA